MNDLACNEFVELVTDYLDRTLDTARTERFLAHRATCPGCAPYLEQIRQTIGLLRDLDRRHFGSTP